MVDHLATTATQAFQLWLRDDEPALGWPHPGATVSAYEQPFNTWASMPQLIDVESWPADDRPGTIAYFCGALDAPWPPDGDGRDYARRAPRARRAATRSSSSTRDLGAPAARHSRTATASAGSCCAGATAQRGADALDTQLLRRQRRSVRPLRAVAPGTDRYRLRSDESGYDNLSSPATGPTPASTRAASRPRCSRASRPPTRCSAAPRGYRIAGAWLM